MVKKTGYTWAILKVFVESVDLLVKRLTGYEIMKMPFFASNFKALSPSKKRRHRRAKVKNKGEENVLLNADDFSKQVVISKEPLDTDDVQEEHLEDVLDEHEVASVVSHNSLSPTCINNEASLLLPGLVCSKSIDEFEHIDSQKDCSLIDEKMMDRLSDVSLNRDDKLSFSSETDLASMSGVGTSVNSPFERDELEKKDNLSHLSLFRNCTTELPKPLSYTKYPEFERPVIHLSSILRTLGYRSFVFGGIIYRVHTKPSDIDLVIPHFMTMDELETLKTDSPNDTLIARIKEVVTVLSLQKIQAHGLNSFKMPGYIKDCRYTLPLAINFEGEVYQADLTLYAQGLDAHAKNKDITLSAIYYDGYDSEMLEYLPFHPLVDLKLRIIRPIFEPVSMIRNDPSLIFRFMRLFSSELLNLDISLHWAFIMIQNHHKDVFVSMKNQRLQYQLKQMQSNRDQQLSSLYQLGFFHLLYERLVMSQSPMLLEYANELSQWYQSSYAVYYQQMLFQQQALAYRYHEQKPKVNYKELQHSGFYRKKKKKPKASFSQQDSLQLQQPHTDSSELVEGCSHEGVTSTNI